MISDFFFKVFLHRKYLVLLTVITFPLFAQNNEQSLKAAAVLTPYIAKDYSHLYGMSGFSDSLLKMHFQLYEGYVKHTNLLMTGLKEFQGGDPVEVYLYGALKRRLGWEWDGMRLHELYFENLGGRESLVSSTLLFRRIVSDFGSYQEWKKKFISTGMIRGIGWVILYCDPDSGQLLNTWINEHDLGHLCGGRPLLVMDVFEHAYITQYGLDREKYIQAFFDNIDWAKVSERYNQFIDRNPIES